MLPASQQTPSKGLELHDDVRQFQVSLLLQVSQHTGTEENLGLADAEQVGVQLQAGNLEAAQSPRVSCTPRLTCNCLCKKKKKKSPGNLLIHTENLH